MNSFRVVYFLLNKTIKASQVPVIQAFVTLLFVILYSTSKEYFIFFHMFLDGNGKIISAFLRQGR